MLDLWEFHPTANCFHTAQNHLGDCKSLDLPFLHLDGPWLSSGKVKNISKFCYLSEINFANCSRWSNLLIPQNEKIEKKRRHLRSSEAKAWKRWNHDVNFSYTKPDMFAAISLSLCLLFIVVHMNYQLLDFIMFCFFPCALSPKCTTINLSPLLQRRGACTFEKW